MRTLMQLKAQLPYGAVKEIAEKTGVVRRTVEKVLSGESKNLKVLNGIADYLEEKKNEEQQLLKRIEHALKK